jgi:Uma2 family endonuclease
LPACPLSASPGRFSPQFTLYRLLETLLEYVLVQQELAEVEVFARDSEGKWTSVIYNEPADSFTLPSLGCGLTLAEICEKVNFE